MKHVKLQRLIFLALCCDLGLFTKRIIAPAANILTDTLHIPGGIGTSFSLMFLVVACTLMPKFGCGTLMGIVQSAIALSLGMVGSMGVLAPIGYVVPGFIIDCVIYISGKAGLGDELTMLGANMLSAASASLVANLIVFRLDGIPLLLYIAVAITSGAVCGVLGSSLVPRLRPMVCVELKKDTKDEKQKTDYCNNSRPCPADSHSGGHSL